MRRFLLACSIVLAAALWALVDPNAGVRTYRELDRQLEAAQQRAGALRHELEALEQEAERLQRDPLAIETAIREDLGLARPGEIIVRVESTPDSLREAAQGRARAAQARKPAESLTH
jgi:cell division protein FtsB